jgi:methyl-accepting chemotaxis protein
LQAAQLQHAREDLAGAVERISENLYRITSEISVLSEDIQKAAGASGEKEDTYFTELETSLAKLMDAIREFTEMNRKMSASMLQVARAMGEMTSYIRDVQKVGIAMRITALNACIHAAHIGESGLSLGVLAESIHQLSVNTAGSIEIISRHLASIGEEAESLSRQGGRYDQARLERENGALLAQVETLMKPLRQMDEELSDLLQQFDSDGSTLQQEIEEMASNLRIHDEMDRGIGAVVTSLKEVSGEMRAGLPAGFDMSKAALVDMAARYTMDKEREIHMAVAAAVPAAAAGALATAAADRLEPSAIEGNRDDSESTPAAGGAEADLGDNVELF